MKEFNEMEGMLALTIPIVMVIVVGLIFKWLSDNRVRRELTAASASAELVEKIMAAPVQSPESSLKWGIVSVAIGLALCGIQVLGLDENDPVSFGLVFVFGGGALLLYYAISKNDD
jgi:hypothetical protein